MSLGLNVSQLVMTQYSVTRANCVAHALMHGLNFESFETLIDFIIQIGHPAKGAIFEATADNNQTQLMIAISKASTLTPQHLDLLLDVLIRHTKKINEFFKEHL